jgi:beta-glucosidase
MAAANDPSSGNPSSPAPSSGSQLVGELTVEERVELLSGRDTWQTAEIARLGIGSVKVTDGPNGARGDSTTGAKAVCLPAAIGLGATFDRDLVAEAGALLGRETKRKGSHVLLAPTINLARHPLGGRNFESFGEDPFLTSELGVAYVDGVQSEGVGACAKHFVANDVEFARMTVSSEVDETVLREVYLAPFEAVVDAGVWSIMASYPMLNGIHCTENDWLLTALLRDEWGFDGLVMSDWGATHHPARPVLAGLDLEMPGPPVAFGERLVAAVESGDVPVDVLDARVGRVLDLVARAGRIGELDVEPEQSIDLDDERALARRLAVDGMVLLTNDGTLPASGEPLVCVLGPNASESIIQGGGSAAVPAHRTVSVVDGFLDALGAERVTSSVGCLAHRYLPPPPVDVWAGGDHPILLEEFSTDDCTGEPIATSDRRSIQAFFHGNSNASIASQRWTASMRIDESGSHSFGVLAVGRSRVSVDGVVVADNWTSPRAGDAFFQYASAEVVGQVDLSGGSTVEVVVEWSFDNSAPVHGLRFGHLPPIDEERLIEEAVVAAGAADVAVVVVGLNNEWETEGHDRPGFGLPGGQDELVRRVAAGNPRTVVVVNAGSPVDMPWLDDVAATLVVWYPGQELGHAVADAILGRAEPGGRLPLTWPRRLADTPFELPIPEPGPPRPGATLPYTEGLLIGYRSYDRSGVEPLAAFGFGLGYTSFELGSATAPGGGRGPGDDATVVVPVTNTGDRDGKCVVEAYLEDATPEDTGDIATARPLRVLAGFAVVRPRPAETVAVQLSIPAKVFRRWDPVAGSWVDDGTARRLHIGLSSRDLRSSVTIEGAR